jgi:hypothetical protein
MKGDILILIHTVSGLDLSLSHRAPLLVSENLQGQPVINILFPLSQGPDLTLDPESGP